MRSPAQVLVPVLVRARSIRPHIVAAHGFAQTATRAPCSRRSIRRPRRYTDVALKIWSFAEVGYQETKSSALLQEQLRPPASTSRPASPRFRPRSSRRGERQAGDRHHRRVRRAAGAVAGGRARSQADRRGRPGHGCGHHLFGTASTAAAIAVKEWLVGRTSAAGRCGSTARPPRRAARARSTCCAPASSTTSTPW